MFTIKFYSGDGCRQIIREAESFTILRCPPGEDDGSAEITLHNKGGDSCRIDIGNDGKPSLPDGFPPRFAKAIIENSGGKTTEIISYRSGPYPHSSKPNMGGKPVYEDPVADPPSDIPNVVRWPD